MSFVSCQKNQINTSSKNGSSENKTTYQTINGSSVNPGNQNNPYDSIGYFHNELVSYYFQNGYNSNTTDDSLLSWTDQFLNQNFNVTNLYSIEQNDTFQNGIAESKNALLF